MSDWSENAVCGSHYWYEYEGGTMCSLTTPDKDCRSRGDKRVKVKCAACRMVLHDDCREDSSVKCRATFRDASFKKEPWTPHHWVLQRKGSGTKCKGCNKTLPKGVSWGSGRNSKAFIAVICSWCKDIYHTSCFKLSLIEDHCTLGEFDQIIVPPNWVVYTCKGPKKHDKRKISYSTRPSSSSSKRGLHRKGRADHEEGKRPFHIKVSTSVSSTKTPLLVFVNPKSGGNQGASLIHTFQWYLNPRQVFDLSEGGPALGLQLYQNVANLRILVCGGDGTVGWVLSEIDKLNFINLPPAAILPLGTGNDLARVLNWGASYAGEPIDKLLYNVSDAIIHCLDRWEITVENTDTTDLSPLSPTANSIDEGDSQNSKEDDISEAQTKLPINIMNNYFGVGLDAHIQYQFHTCREAKPEKFNSRAYNKYVYFKGGLADTFEQRYKDLSKFMELICDGEDYTEKIREEKIHCIVFLNIKSYSGGANPWGSHQSGMRQQAMDDGFLEVVGLFSAPTMGALLLGMTGVRICQCRKVIIKTKKSVHCQVDGEPCYIVPSTMRISRRSQSRMLMRWKTKAGVSASVGEESSVSCSAGPPNCTETDSSTPVKVAIQKVTYSSFHKHYGNLEELQALALPLTMVVVQPNATLDTIRPTISKCVKNTKGGAEMAGVLSEDWVFLHKANERLYPISEELETQIPVSDLVYTGIFVLDTGGKGSPSVPKGSPTVPKGSPTVPKGSQKAKSRKADKGPDPLSNIESPRTLTAIPRLVEPTTSQNYTEDSL